MGTETTRLEKLRAILEKTPADTFLLYALALEHRKLGDTKSAIEYLDKVIQQEWGYCYAYHQKGQILEESGELESARQVYRQGIEAAGRKGDQHAASEISASLEMIAGSD